VARAPLASPAHRYDVAKVPTAVTRRSTAVAVAKTQLDGSFVPANVRVQESISKVTTVSNGLRVRTQHKLRPGRYYVKVSGRTIALDCTPLEPCKELWSNARRVIIPRP
jgi:hypothetical protein